jgi:hypothetical protein
MRYIAFLVFLLRLFQIGDKNNIKNMESEKTQGSQSLGEERYRAHWGQLSFKGKYWDPVSLELSEAQIENCKVSNVVQSRKFGSDKRDFRTNLSAIIFFAIAILSIWLMMLFINFSLEDLSGVGAIILIFATAIIPAYYFALRKQEKPFAEMSVAQEFGWFYDPNVSTRKWEALAKDYPEIFQKGDRGRNISSQFWGLFENRTPFWSANFNYKVASEQSPIRTETVYAFRLPREAAHDFVLKPQNKLREMETSLLESGLTTEWNDFNKVFHIDFEGELGEFGANILQVLSPDVQEKLFEFREAVGPFSLLFRKNVMLVSFQGKLKLRYTNFSKEMVLDARDKEEISKRMELIVSLADAILPCIG